MLLSGGLLLPNLLSWATLITPVDIGLPPRTAAIVFYASLAILARRIPFALTIVLFLGLRAFDIVQTISLMFGLAPTELATAIDHARRVHFFASPTYLMLIATMTATTVAALACLSQRNTLMRANTLILFFMALAFGTLDYLNNVSPHYSFGSASAATSRSNSASKYRASKSRRAHMAIMSSW